MSRRLADALAEVARAMKIAGAMTIIILFFALGTAAIIHTPTTETYSQDEFTVANSTNGEQVIVTYEVRHESEKTLSVSDERRLMQNMDRVASCANERIDAYITNHSKQEARGANLEEITIPCEENDISIEQVTVSNSLT